MKYLIIAAIFCGMPGMLLAQRTQTDSAKSIADTVRRHRHNVKITIGRDNDTTVVTTGGHHHHGHDEPNSGFSFGLTFSNLHLGFATLVDNGSFTLRPQDDFLDYRQIKTSNVGFDVLKIGYRFNDNFKVALAGGFDWTLIRLTKNISIVPDQPSLTYNTDNINYSKNRFSSNYLVLPLSFALRTKEYSDGKRFEVVFGPEGGFLIDGMLKQISPQYGKQKDHNDFYFTKFEYGSFLRIGYGDIGLYAKYYFNDMFENSPAQAGLKSFDFGLMIGF